MTSDVPEGPYATAEVSDVVIPPAVAVVAGREALHCVWRNELGGLTFELPAISRFLKWAPAGSGLPLLEEATRLRWARRYAPVLYPGRMTESNLLAEVGLTPRAARVVTQLAAEVARREGHNYVGTEHLLVALIEERAGLASQVLYKQGVAQTVLDATLTVIRSPDVEKRP